MKEFKGFKCELTGALYEDRRGAARSEFRAMMKRIGGSLPAMGSINSAEIMNWLGGNIESEIYPTVPDKLREALDYFDANLRKADPPKFGSEESEFVSGDKNSGRNQ